MKFFTNKSTTPLEMTFKFLIYLVIAYFLYFTFIREYGTFLMMISSNIVASIFDMHVVNSGNYLEDAKLVSDIGLQHSITQEIAYATLPLPKIVVDRIMIVITNTSIILALSMLLIRSFKVLTVVLALMVTIHIFSVSSILMYFVFEVSPHSPILTHYLQALGVTQTMIDISYIFSGVSFYYLKYFTPFFIAYYAWETAGYMFVEKGTVKVKSFIPFFVFVEKKK